MDRSKFVTKLVKIHDMYDDIIKDICLDCIKVKKRNVYGKPKGISGSGCCGACASHKAYLGNTMNLPKYDKYKFHEDRGFLKRTGCKLPKELRSYTCLSHMCVDIKSVIPNHQIYNMVSWMIDNMYRFENYISVPTSLIDEYLLLIEPLIDDILKKGVYVDIYFKRVNVFSKNKYILFTNWVHLKQLSEFMDDGRIKVKRMNNAGKNSKGQFIKGSSPWNKNKKGIHLSPATEFKPGQNVGNGHPSWKGGIQTMKNDCKYKYTGNGKRVRLPRVLYEETHGKIPKGYVILHIDGDKHNDDISNLKAVTRSDLMRINAKKLLVTDLDY